MSVPEISTKGPDTVRPGELVEVEVAQCWGRWKCCRKKKMIPRQAAFDEINALHTRVEVVASELNPHRKEVRRMMERRDADGTVSARLEISWE